MPDKNLEILKEAAARNMAAVLSLPSAGMLRNHKSRFIAELDGGLLIQGPGEDRELIAELLRTRTPCLVSLRSGIYKVSFATFISRVEPEWRLNDSITVRALLLEFPEKVLATQKRSDYRVEIPLDSDMGLRVWRMGRQATLADSPTVGSEVTAKMQDISTGGIGVKLIGANGQQPRISMDDRLRLALSFHAETLIMEASMRTPSTPPQGDTISTGIKFKQMEDSLEGRRTHARLVSIVGELQRKEIRMSRLGLMKSA